MAASPIAKKLGLKEGHRILVLNAPEEYVNELSLPDGAKLETKPGKVPYDCVQVFAEDMKQLDRHVKAGLTALPEDGLLWVCYPKKTSGIKTDLNRDCDWTPLKAAGYVGVSLFSIDDTWSAMRFRPQDKVGQARK